VKTALKCFVTTPGPPQRSSNEDNSESHDVHYLSAPKQNFEQTQWSSTIEKNVEKDTG